MTTGALTAGLRDTAAMTRRNLYHYLRVPALITLALTQGVLFVVMFTYVFKGAIQTPGVAYIDYLMPGIVILAVAFGSPNTGVGLAEDLTTGMLDRFRSLPMARPALLAGRTLADAIRNLVVVLAVAFGSPNTGVGLAEDLTTGMLDRFRSLPLARPALLAGRTLADAIRNVVVVLLMISVGYLIGFRFHVGPLATVAAIALPVAVGYVLSWFAALVGLVTGDAETASTASLLPIIHLVFTSSALVPISTMPGPLQAWADVNPITPIIDAIRALIIGGPTATPVLQATAWLAALAALAIPLAIWRYHHATQ